MAIISFISFPLTDLKFDLISCDVIWTKWQAYNDDLSHFSPFCLHNLPRSIFAKQNFLILMKLDWLEVGRCWYQCWVIVHTSTTKFCKFWRLDCRPCTEVFFRSCVPLSYTRKIRQMLHLGGKLEHASPTPPSTLQHTLRRGGTGFDVCTYEDSELDTYLQGTITPQSYLHSTISTVLSPQNIVAWTNKKYLDSQILDNHKSRPNKNPFVWNTKKLVSLSSHNYETPVTISVTRSRVRDY